MNGIPSWLWIVIQLAIKIGSPYLLGLIHKWMLSLPEEVRLIIEALIHDIRNPEVSTPAAKEAALASLKKCTVGCAPELKNDK